LLEIDIGPPQIEHLAAACAGIDRADDHRPEVWGRCGQERRLSFF
jgi:hypothetical protein